MDSVIRRDLEYVWHPCSQMKDYRGHPPLHIVKGRGVYLFDSRGRKYIDAISSWWVNLFGHANPRLNRVLREQSERLEHVILAGATHDPVIDCAEALVKAAPRGLRKVFFADNGSSAVEAALKMSFQYWRQAGRERKIFIALAGGYHGETLGALSVGGLPLYREKFSPLLFKVKLASTPCCGACPFGKTKDSCGAECFASMESAVEKAGARSVSAVIIEPLVQCANRMNMYPPVYLSRLRRLCTREKIHLIADEIAVGFGRTGTLFACEQAEISPDILCLSKGITGGYMPFSAVLATQKIYSGFYGSADSGKAFLHSHSYTGNPLAARLALEVLRMFRHDSVLERMRPAVSAMRDALQEIGHLRGVANVRQTGLIGAFDLVDPRTGKSYPEKRRMGWVVARAAIKKGAFLRPLGDTIYFMPPLSITSAEMKRLKEITLESVHKSQD